MHIQFGTYVLATGQRVWSSSGLRISTVGNLQVSGIVRSTNAIGYNRKNYRTEVSFAVDYLASSINEGEQLIQTQGETLKSLGIQDLAMTNSQSLSKRTLKNAFCVSCVCGYVGRTVHFEYTFSGEYITPAT